MTKKKPQKPKTELGRKLFIVRRQLPPELLEEWYRWFLQHRENMQPKTFDYITRGDYISKENVRLAMDGLRKGKDLLEKFEAEVKSV